jgi:hypothetical protein
MAGINSFRSVATLSANVLNIHSKAKIGRMDKQKQLQLQFIEKNKIFRNKLIKRGVKLLHC